MKKSKSNSFNNLLGGVPSDKEEKSDYMISNDISVLSLEEEQDQK